MKKPGAEIRRDAELPSFEDDNPDFAGPCFLFFDLAVKFKLRRVKDKGSKEPVLGLSLRQCSAKYGRSVLRRVARSPSFGEQIEP